MIWLRETLPADAIICNGAGNYAAWMHRFFRFRRLASHIAPTSASMGYGMPAAVAMQRLYPERRIVSINGDGDFLMNGQEFATAVQYGLPIVVVVLDNGILRHHPHASGTRVSRPRGRHRPDQSGLRRLCAGLRRASARRSSAPADFPDAFEAAVRVRPARDHSREDTTPTASRRTHDAERHPRRRP